MATYRLKSKLYGELDKGERKENNGIFGISTGKALLGATAALGAYKMAGAGKFGMGAQNAVNKFRMNTSAAGSTRFANAQKALEANRNIELKRVSDWGKTSGKTGKQIWGAKENVYKKYDQYMGPSNSAASYYS